MLHKLTIKFISLPWSASINLVNSYLVRSEYMCRPDVKILIIFKQQRLCGIAPVRYMLVREKF